MSDIDKIFESFGDNDSDRYDDGDDFRKCEGFMRRVILYFYWKWIYEYDIITIRLTAIITKTNMVSSKCRQKPQAPYFSSLKAITKAQYDKSLGDLIEKMGMERVLRETGEALVLPRRKPLI